MTAPTYTTTSVTTTETVDTAALAGCPACPHPMAAHDPIGARFCRATAAQAIDRGCACRIG